MSATIVPLLRAGELEQASNIIAGALAADPENPDHLRASGVLYAWRHEWHKAREAFDRALEFQSVDAAWWRDVGIALLGAGAPREAAEPLERALALVEDASALAHYGEALELLGRVSEASRFFKRSIEIDPNCVFGYEGLARSYQNLGQEGLVLKCFRRAARLRRFDASGLHQLADAQFQVGKLHSCLRSYRRAIRLNPVSSGIRSGYLFASLHDLEQTPLDLKRSHESWFELHPESSIPRCEFPNDPDPSRRVRIGYVSWEYRSSPTEYFLLPLLQAHHRDEFSVYCYHTAGKDDEVTGEYQEAAEYWRDLKRMQPSQTLRTILEDRIDILVDTSGHFTPDVLRVFHQRGAPVQVALPVYPCTTGCKEIDFMLSDRWTTPDERFESQYSEKVYRLPSGYVVYNPPRDAPEMTSLPAIDHRFVTFGLFQRPAKLNKELWRATAEILRETCGSRLLVHNGAKDLDGPESDIRRDITSILKELGVAADRVDFAGRRDIRDHLTTVAGVDIALDTFPYSGHTTTGDALWMGVPVVTYAGATHASRVSCSLLSRVGMSEWVGTSIQEYIEIAISRSRDIRSLALTRASLRERMAESSICRPEIVIREMETGYRWMWAQWCRAMRKKLVRH